MGLVLKYAKQLANGTWQYRRRVPTDIAEIIKKREFKQKLGDTEREALAAYHRVHAGVERHIAAARRAVALRPTSGPMTDREAYLEALRRVAELEQRETPEEDFDLVADGIVGSYRVDAETGTPLQVSSVDRHTVNILRNGPAKVLPEVTLADAKRHYLAEHMSGPEHEKDKRAVNRVGRVLDMAIEALGRNPVVTSLSRDDARKVRDHLLSRVKSTGEAISPASVARELNMVKAVVTHAKVEMGLPGDFQNPFNKLEMRSTGAPTSDSEKRDPLPPEVLSQVRQRVLAAGNPQLRLIWRLLEGTGCRLAEVTGLRVEDVILTGPLGGQFPHIRVTWHEDRRVKTKASIRHVPLVGDALEAAKEALALPRPGHMLFSSYGRLRGSDAASAALMKHIRRVSDHPKHVVHSLRHNMKDNLDLAEVAELVRNLILGWSLGSVGDRVYGGGMAKLRQTTRAMRKGAGLPVEPAPEGEEE